MKPLFKFNSFVSAIILLLAGSFLLGASYIAILPIWEGFDETAHFSYIQQVADSKKLPLDGKDPISTDIEKYYQYAPVPKAIFSETPSKKRLTYQSFFLKSDESLSDSKEFVHSTNSPRKYFPGRGHNWESQHPPLYYILLSPIYLATKQLSWGKQIFILRITSYTFAWLGLVVAVFTCLELAKKQSSRNKIYLWNWAAIGAGLWPFFFPAWFSDMARIGNDSICCLLLSLVWLVSIKMTTLEKTCYKHFLLLGFLLSLGCLTKVIFIPITFGVLSFWLFREWNLRGEIGFLKTTRLCCLIIVAIVVSSGWWYWNNYVQYGVISGNIDLKFLKQAGGLWDGLEINFSFLQWVRSNAALAVTFGWIGSWSLVKPQLIFLTPIIFMLFLVVYAYLQNIRHRKIISSEWLPTWLALPILIGLSYHILVRIALTGEGRGTPGFYLHILAAPMSAALGLSLYQIWVNNFLKTITQILFGYIILFSMCMTWSQSLFFSGLISASKEERIYSFPEHLPPFLGLIEVYQRLHILAYPKVGFSLLIIGWATTAIGLVFTQRFACQSTNIFSSKKKN